MPRIASPGTVPAYAHCRAAANAVRPDAAPHSPAGGASGRIFSLIHREVFQRRGSPPRRVFSGTGIRAAANFFTACLFMTGQLFTMSAAAQEQRVVSVGGAITEIIYALGAEKKLVAVDTTSLHPKAALLLPKVGYMRTLSAEGVLSMRPSLVLATSEAGPPPVIAQLKSAGVKLDIVSADHSFDELRNKVHGE
jgi:ABC-type hemin transport system substrate-binding protein